MREITCSLCGAALESWELGTPRASYHCPCGPSNAARAALQVVITLPAGESGTPRLCDSCTSLIDLHIANVGQIIKARAK